MDKIIKREITTSMPLQVREASEGEQSRTITGYAILFDTPSAALYEDEEDIVREVISRDAVPQELLDSSDIKMTMFHDRQLILARSNKGNGTLTYHIDDKGVGFSFDAPHTVDGDKALELVKRGDISGCSFAFSTYYGDGEYVARHKEVENGKTVTTCTVNRMLGIYDMTLAADPAYPDTECWARELVEHKEEIAEDTPATAPSDEGEQIDQSAPAEEQSEEVDETETSEAVAAEVAALRDYAKSLKHDNDE